MNIVHIAGHLGADPEVRFTSSGQKVTTLRVAARARKGKTDETIWWRVTLWGEQYDKMVSFLKKGSSVMVVGELAKPEIFNDREGKPQIAMNVTAMNIQFSPFGKTQQGGQPAQTPISHQAEASSARSSNTSFHEDAFDRAYDTQKTSSQMGANATMTSQDMDDEVPF